MPVKLHKLDESDEGHGEDHTVSFGDFKGTHEEVKSKPDFSSVSYHSRRHGKSLVTTCKQCNEFVEVEN